MYQYDTEQQERLSGLLSNSETDKELKRIQKSYNELGAGNVLDEDLFAHGGKQESAAAVKDAVEYKKMV